MNNTNMFDVVEVIQTAEDKDFSDEWYDGGVYRVWAGSLIEGDILLNKNILLPSSTGPIISHEPLDFDNKSENSSLPHIEYPTVYMKYKVVRIVWRNIPQDAVEFFRSLPNIEIIGHEPLDFDNKSENSDENSEKEFDIVKVTYLDRPSPYDGELITNKYYAPVDSLKEGEVIINRNVPVSPRWKITGILKYVPSDVAKFFEPYDITKLIFFEHYNGYNICLNESTYPELEKKRKIIDEEERKMIEKRKMQKIFAIKGIIRFIILAIITFIGAVIGDNIVMDTGLWEVIGEFTGVWLGAIIGVAVGNWLLYRGTKNEQI